MADGQITYIDLVKPTDSITKAIEQLTNLDAVYADLLNKIKKDAAQIEASIKSTSGANKDQRETIKKSAEQVDKLVTAEQKLKESRTNNAVELQKLKAVQQEQNKLTNLSIKLNKSKEGSYDKLSAQYSLNKIRLNKMSEAERNATKRGIALEKNTKAIYERMNLLQKATGKATLQVGQYERGIGRASKATLIAKNTVNVATKGFGAMLKPMLAIGVASLGIRAVFGFIKKNIGTMADFEKAMDKVSAVTNALPNEFALLSENAKDLGKITSKSASEVAGLQLEFAKLGLSTQEILNATEATISLSIAAGSDLAESAKVAASTLRGLGLDAKETQRVTDVMAKSFSSSGLDMEKFASAMVNAQVSAKTTGRTLEETTAFMSVLADTGVDASKIGTDLRIIFSKLAIKGIDLNDALDMVEKSSNKVATAQKLVKDRAFSSLITLAENREKTDELTEAYENSAGAAKHMADIMEDNLRGELTLLSSAWEGFVLEINEGSSSITGNIRGMVNGLRNILGTISDDILLEKFGLDRKLFQDTENVGRGFIKFYKDLNEARKDVVKGATTVGDFDKAINSMLKFQSLFANSNDVVDQAKFKVYGESIDKLRVAKSAFYESLLVQDEKNRKAQEKLRAIALKKEQDDIRNSNNELSKINLDTVEKRMAKEKALTAFIKQQVNKRLGDEKAAIPELSKALADRYKVNQDFIDKTNQAYENASQGKDIYELVGLNMSDESKDAISMSTQFALDALNQVAQAKVDAANRAVEASQIEIDAAQSKVDAEIEARNSGYASNVSGAQRELALAKKTQDRALKDLEKAAKAKQQIETLQQVSSLITAAAGIWATLQFPWAIPAIAAMFGSFAFAKVKSAQVAKQSLGEGGMDILEGGSHASGNDIYLGNQNGVDQFAEGGEARAIISKKNTRKYRNILPDIIGSLNKGTFEQKYTNVYNTEGVSLSVVSGGGSNLKSLEKDVDEIKKQGERKYFVNGKGQTIETYKNLRRIYAS